MTATQLLRSQIRSRYAIIHGHKNMQSTIALFTKLSYIDRTESQERNRWQKMCWASRLRS
jgi:hypothetical protein